MGKNREQEHLNQISLVIQEGGGGGGGVWG